MNGKNLLIIILLSFLVNGCATTLSKYRPVYLSTNETTTGIVMKFSRNMGQTGVIGHLIKIDDKNEIQVDAVSELTIYLNPGPHKLGIVSISSLSKSVWYPVPVGGDDLFYFGKPIEETIVLKENEIKVMKFTAPFIGTTRGKIEIVN